MSSKLAFDTLAVHAGVEPDPSTGAVMTPIYQTATYRQERIGQHRGYEYSRTANPTRTALEDCLAILEGGTHALAFASGMAAIDAVLHLLDPGDHVLAVDDLYGGTYRIFERVYVPLGLRFSYVPASASPTSRRPILLSSPNRSRPARGSSGLSPRPIRC